MPLSRTVAPYSSANREHRPADPWAQAASTAFHTSHQPDRVDLRHVRLRTKVTKGAGSREAGVAMAFKLLDAAQARWRRINGHELVPLVRAGATFIDGKLQERKEAQTGTTDTNKTWSVAA
jgi:hypothetical protein